jgi:hypothetical protein
MIQYGSSSRKQPKITNIPENNEHCRFAEIKKLTKNIKPVFSEPLKHKHKKASINDLSIKTRNA